MQTSVRSLHSTTVAFTTPPNYAPRLSEILAQNGHVPLWCPTLLIQPTPSNLTPFLAPHTLRTFSAVAFTSRTTIQAFLQAAATLSEPPLPPSGPAFTLAALGKDADLIDANFVLTLCRTHPSNGQRIRVVVPASATPTALAAELGAGAGRRVLCPVPRVVGVEEPPVVPGFLRELRAHGWVPVRVEAYETKWAGPECAEGIVRATEEERLDAVVFTSSAEVEGLLKSLREFGLGFGDLRNRCPGLVVAAHGPVTASGARRLGVKVDVVSSKFDSFDGVVDALNATFARFRV
ncbi:hypothetical protein VNO78_03060 [Psophocarpus tetragonolobus]|uniref:Tetrapyrrole biosynthesis uroporphyrinogen III synthase domain-containing protein n=1 Tax=Psophocarpus tetragonolobus TaxID=3891 RepID=A0AAN9T1E3_PSOTE